MKHTIEKISKSLNEQLETVKTEKDLEELRINYLGKKGQISELTNMLKDLSIEEKKEFGSLMNNLKNEATSKIEEAKKELERQLLEKKLKEEKIDITLPGTKISAGAMHPLSKVITELEEIFVSMGYDVVEGPEVELDLYNFEKLNLPKDHPARDSQDSFYITEEMLLRTQTSPVQARTMEANTNKEAIRIICPGKVYRRDDDDATHSHQFMQLEGLVVDKNISLAHLKGTLELLAKRLFGEDREIRLRPSFFPFTEPSFEVDVTCTCGKKGCSICKNTGWIEVLGSGKVHPNVLRNCGYDPEEYTGFAFGIGIERIAMLKYGFTDIRGFYQNDLRMLKDFNRVNGGEN